MNPIKALRSVRATFESNPVKIFATAKKLKLKLISTDNIKNHIPNISTEDASNFNVFIVIDLSCSIAQTNMYWVVG